MRVAIYARVSTKDQQTTPMQIKDLTDYARLRDWKVVKVFEETISGASDRRPQYSELMNEARQRKIDAVLVWKLDRWGRSLHNIVNSLHELRELGVDFVSFKESLDFTTSHGRAMAGMIAVFATFEREQLTERVKAGVKEAKKKGVQMGRPQKINDKMASKAKQLQAVGYSHAKIMSHLNLGRGSVYKILGSSKIKKGRPVKNEPQKLIISSLNNIVANLSYRINSTIISVSALPKLEEMKLDLPAVLNEKLYYAEITDDDPKDDFDREVEADAAYRKSESGVYEEYCHEKNLRLHHSPDFYDGTDDEYYRIRKYVFERQDLEERGWNKGAIKKFLGSPNFVTHYKYYSPGHFWFKRDVIPWESKPEFKSFLEKSKVTKERKKISDAEKKLKLEQERELKRRKEKEKINEYTLTKNSGEKKLALIRLYLSIENNSKFVRKKGKVIKEIEHYILSDFDYDEEDDTTFILKIKYKTENELNEIMEELLSDIGRTADDENCFSESNAVEIDMERSW